MKTLSKWVDVAVKWVFLSSADPTKASATIKFALVGLIPLTIKAAAFFCGIGLACLSFLNEQWLDMVIAIIANIAYFAFGLVAAIGSAAALIRKVSSTVNGTNAVIS